MVDLYLPTILYAFRRQLAVFSNNRDRRINRALVGVAKILNVLLLLGSLIADG
jgi:hypothetical protein